MFPLVANGRVKRNPVKPCAKPGLPVKVLQVLKCFYKCILSGFLRFHAIIQNFQRNGKGKTFVLIYQKRISLSVSGQNPVEQFIFFFLSDHGLLDAGLGIEVTGYFLKFSVTLPVTVCVKGTTFKT